MTDTAAFAWITRDLYADIKNRITGFLVDNHLVLS